MLHLLNPSVTLPQSVPFVSAVVAAEPIKNKIYPTAPRASFSANALPNEGKKGTKRTYECDCERNPMRKDPEKDARRAEKKPEEEVHFATRARTNISKIQNNPPPCISHTTS